MCRVLTSGGKDKVQREVGCFSDEYDSIVEFVNHIYFLSLSLFLSLFLVLPFFLFALASIPRLDSHHVILIFICRICFARSFSWNAVTIDS